MRFKSWIVSLGLLAGCGSAHLDAGRLYLARGNLPVAVEILDRGIGAEPGNAELRDTAVLARQSYERGLRQEIDRLRRAGRHLLALGRLIELEETARRAEQISIPGDIPADVERERREVAGMAVEQLERELDERSGRGSAMRADLWACRQILALVEKDVALERTCDRLLSRFKLLTVIEAGRDAQPEARRLFPAIARMMRERNPELIELVDPGQAKHNAVMQVWVGEPRVHHAPWVMTRRDAFHRWVPKLDRKGHQVEETTVIEPTAKDIEDARKRELPAPEAKTVRKKVWEPIAGEHRVFRTERRVELPFEVTIENLQEGDVVLSFTGVAEARSGSSYFEYAGDPRGRDPAPVRFEGRQAAPALRSEEALAAEALGQIPGRIVGVVIERMK